MADIVTKNGYEFVKKPNVPYGYTYYRGTVDELQRGLSRRERLMYGDDPSRIPGYFYFKYYPVGQEPPGYRQAVEEMAKQGYVPRVSYQQQESGGEGFTRPPEGKVETPWPYEIPRGQEPSEFIKQPSASIDLTKPLPQASLLQQSALVSEKTQLFSKKWQPYIKNNQFIGTEYQYDQYKQEAEAITEQVETIQREFKNKYTQLPDGTYILKTDLPVWEEYKDFQSKLKKGEIVALPNNEYITREELEKQPEGVQQILISEGFVGLQNLGELFLNPDTGKPYSSEESSKWWSNYEATAAKLKSEGKWDVNNPEYQALQSSVKENMRVNPEFFARSGIKALSFVAPPAKALLPEFTIKDVAPTEWGLAAVNTALIAAAFVPGGIMASTVGKAAIATLSATGAGLVGFETGKHWNNLSPAERAVGVGGTVLYALPVLTTVARGVKFSPVKIPTAEGDVVAWRGLSLFDNPVIGKSQGRWVVAARNITLPEARLILNGYKPETMLETKVFVNPKTLEKAGFSASQIDYLTVTLRDRNLFAGQKSPYLDKEELIKPTEYIDADEIQVLMRQIANKGSKVKQVDILYGSPTMKVQVAPELRNWRPIHDWDISTTMNAEDTAVFTKGILQELDRLGGTRQYRISPKSPTLIEKKIGDQWVHIADIHAHEQLSTMSATNLPESKLDVTGSYSYGRLVSEPAITVKYPSIGRFDIMRLSETGVRKADTILRVRQTEALTPKEKYIATGGYKYGQDLANHLAAIYDLEAVPVNKFSFWKRLQQLASRVKREPVTVGTYREQLFSSNGRAIKFSSEIELAPSLEKQGIEFAESALHELVHGKVSGILRSREGKMRSYYSNTPEFKDVSQYIRNHPEVRDTIDNAVNELVTIHYVERLSGASNVSYASDIISRLEELVGSPVARKIVGLSQKISRKMDVPHRVSIEKAWGSFTAKNYPSYAAILKKSPVFRPPERGIASPGVPKDAADFYVILRTFKGEKVAEEWAEAWAKSMGYTSAEIKESLPNIVKAFEKVAKETPSDLIGYRFHPSKSTGGTSPSIKVNIPRSLTYVLAKSPSLKNTISSPINPYSIASSLSPDALPSPASLPSYSLAPSRSASVVPSVSAKTSISPVASTITSPKVSPKISAKPSVVPSPSAPPSSAVPSTIPSVLTRPSTKPSTTISVTPSPPVSPPPTKPPPEPRPVPKYARMPEAFEEEARSWSESDIAWRQGFVWWVVRPPYKTRADVRVVRNTPAGATIVTGTGSAYKTIQALSGEAPIDLMLDLGIMDVHITSPTKKAGKPQAIRFKRDVKRRTRGDITLKGIKVTA